MPGCPQHSTQRTYAGGGCAALEGCAARWSRWFWVGRRPLGLVLRYFRLALMTNRNGHAHGQNRRTVPAARAPRRASDAGVSPRPYRRADFIVVPVVLAIDLCVFSDLLRHADLPTIQWVAIIGAGADDRHPL